MASCYNVIVENGDWKKLMFVGSNLEDAIIAAEDIPMQNGTVYVVWLNDNIPCGYVTENGSVINLYGGRPEPYYGMASAF